MHREACRGVLRQSIRALNSGNLHPAIVSLHEVLRWEPCNIKALYALMRANAQLRDHAAATIACGQLESVYSHLRLPNRIVVLGTAQEIVNSLDGSID